MAPDFRLLNRVPSQTQSCAQQKMRMLTRIPVFYSNVQNVYQRYNLSLTTFPTETSHNLLGVEQALESMFDDMLAGLASANLIIGPPDGQSTQPANTTVSSIAIGEASYIYAIAAINFLLVALFVAEALRTRGWTNLSRFNYNDLHSVIIASSVGGKGIAEKAVKATGRPGTMWSADPADAAVGSLRVRLVEDGKGVALITAGASIASSAISIGGVGGYDTVPLVDRAEAAETGVEDR